MSTYDARGAKHHGSGRPDGGQYATQAKAETSATLTRDRLTLADLPDGMGYEVVDDLTIVSSRRGDEIARVTRREDGTAGWEVASGSLTSCYQDTRTWEAHDADTQDDAIRAVTGYVIDGVASAPQSLDEWPKVVVTVHLQAYHQRGYRVDVGFEEVDLTEVLAAANPGEREHLLGDDDELMGAATERGLFDHDGPFETDTDDVLGQLSKTHPWLLEGPACEVPPVAPNRTAAYTAAKTAIDALDPDARQALIAELLPPSHPRRPGAQPFVIIDEDGNVDNDPDIPVLDLYPLARDYDLSHEREDHGYTVRDLRDRAAEAGATAVVKRCDEWFADNPDLHPDHITGG